MTFCDEEFEVTYKSNNDIQKKDMLKIIIFENIYSSFEVESHVFGHLIVQ